MTITVDLLLGFEAIGIRNEKGWQYACDGAKCTNVITIPRRYARVGVKTSGWLVCFEEAEDGTQDKNSVLVLCPGCAR